MTVVEIFGNFGRGFGIYIAVCRNSDGRSFGYAFAVLPDTGITFGRMSEVPHVVTVGKRFFHARTDFG